MQITQGVADVAMAKQKIDVVILENDTKLLQTISSNFLDTTQLYCLDASQIDQAAFYKPQVVLVAYQLLKENRNEIWQLKKVIDGIIICYADQDSSKQAVEALKLGADDYWLLNDITETHILEYLPTTEQYQLDLHRIQEENRNLQDTVERFADHIRKRTKYFIESNEALQKEVELRKIQESTLEQVIQRLTSHLDNSPLAVVEWDREYNILSWSRQAEEIFGWKAHEVLGRKVPTQHFAHPADEESVSKYIKRLFDKKEKNNISFNRNITKDGNTVYCEWYNTALYNEWGDIDVILSIVHDITSFKLYEQELLASQERFEKLSQASFDAIIIHENGVLIDCNQKYLDLFQRTFDECVGINTLDFFTPQSREVIQHYISDNSQLPYEITGIKKDGTHFPVEVVAKSIHYNGKQLRLGALRDISQRKKAEQKLVESEERFRSTFEQAAVGMAHISLDGKIVRVNQKFCDITHYDKQELVHLPIEDLLKNSDIEGDKGAIENLLLGREDYHITEKNMLTRKGQRSWIHITISCVRENDEALYFMVVIQDITKRKKTEFELKQAHRELDKFVYNTSHDLRGPIASLIGLCEVALLEIKEEKALGYLKMIDETAQRMSKILSSLLLVNDIKKRELQLEEIDFNELLDESRSIFDKKGKLENVRFVVENKQSFPLLSDKQLISNMLQYVLDNSLRYMKSISEEASFVKVSIESELPNQTKITIEDNGIGIPKYIADKVFEMFFRGTERSKGFGLGLYITKHIVHKLGGRIMIDSTMLDGAKLIILLPSISTSPAKISALH